MFEGNDPRAGLGKFEFILLLIVVMIIILIAIGIGIGVIPIGENIGDLKNASEIVLP